MKKLSNYSGFLVDNAVFCEATKKMNGLQGMEGTGYDNLIQYLIHLGFR